MKITDQLKQGYLLFDGGMGTLLQKQGLKPGELPETWNITHKQTIIEMHKAYYQAGSDVISTNTFGANRLKFTGKDGTYSVEEIIGAAMDNAVCARAQMPKDRERYIALDVGPCGKLLKPLGDLDFEDAVELFAQMIRCGAEHGADLILIETMNDAYETKAAVLAAKENCDLPVFVTNVYDESGKLMTGADPAAMVALLEGLGVDALGLNCSLGPDKMLPIVRELCGCASVPVIANPNAGLPHVQNGQTEYDIDADAFAGFMAQIAAAGATVLGGCCGTTPAYIEKLKTALQTVSFAAIQPKNRTVVSSFTHAVAFEKRPVLIGERINPTGKSRFKQALRENDLDYILNEGVAQQEKGVDILDVNVGLPEIDEPSMMRQAVLGLQSVCDLPLQIDTSDVAAMESAMRIYNGKPLVNSVNGKAESMHAIFPLVKKYGGVVIGLTLDESGIPKTAEGRLQIVEKIYATAKTYGIEKKDIIIDPLAMAISSDTKAAVETLKTVRAVTETYKGKTSLGVSNISFGLPNREFITSSFFVMAMENGLSAAIMNPHSMEMMKAYHSFCALAGLDENCKSYIDFATGLSAQIQVSGGVKAKLQDVENPLQKAIVKGLKEQAAVCTEELLKTHGALEIIDCEIIPALDIVGKGFEEKTVFLPQLLMSAEAAKAAFETVRKTMPANDAKKGKIVLATVHGDIHDIGKNIVKVLLQNYGYEVLDLGKDVPPQVVCDAVVQNHIRLAGLSALMTTTVPAMEETIKRIRKAAPDCKVVVGGAVMTKSYAQMIGADRYAKDAMETVRYAESIFGGKDVEA